MKIYWSYRPIPEIMALPQAQRRNVLEALDGCYSHEYELESWALNGAAWIVAFLGYGLLRDRGGLPGYAAFPLTLLVLQVPLAIRRCRSMTTLVPRIQKIIRQTDFARHPKEDLIALCRIGWPCIWFALLVIAIQVPSLWPPQKATTGIIVTLCAAFLVLGGGIAAVWFGAQLRKALFAPKRQECQPESVRGDKYPANLVQ